MDTPAAIRLADRSPAARGFRMPAEWAAHSRCWMAWPTPNALWPDLEAARSAYADVANAIAAFEPLVMLVHPDNASDARRILGPGVTVIESAIDDAWMRDCGPSFVKSDATGMVAGVAWRFNCWGGYTPDYLDDAQVAHGILDYLGFDAYCSSLVLEGGAFHVDGDGTLITTESVVLNPNRNPGMSKAMAERELCRATGAVRIIWLPGDPDGETADMTDGHVDGIACFLKPGVVLFENDRTATGAAARLDRENRRALELATDARGRRLEVIDLEVDHSGIGEGFELFCQSYINFYLANGGVIMPAYGVGADDQVRDTLGRLFPERRVTMVNINAIAPGGGGIHCITQQQPA